MRENAVSKMPVVDDKGQLIGIVTPFDMLKSLKTKERMNNFSMAAEMERVMQIPISTIMNTHPVTGNAKLSLTDIVALMNNYRKSGVIITVNNYPTGIVVLKDLLEFYVSGLKKEGVY